MCELIKNGFPKDCKLCKNAFFETFTMCSDRDPNLTQEMYDELYSEEDFEDNFSQAEADRREMDEYFTSFDGG